MKENQEKKHWICRWEKNKAAEEKKLTVIIKRVLWEFNLYWKFISTDEYKNKKKLTSSTPVTVFLITEILLSLYDMTLKFSDFQFVSINCFV